MLMSTSDLDYFLDKLFYTIYYIARDNNWLSIHGGEKMSWEQERLKLEIEEINDREALEKVRIFIMGMLAQQQMERTRHPPKGKDALG